MGLDSGIPIIRIKFETIKLKSVLLTHATYIWVIHGSSKRFGAFTTSVDLSWQGLCGISWEKCHWNCARCRTKEMGLVITILKLLPHASRVNELRWVWDGLRAPWLPGHVHSFHISMSLRSLHYSGIVTDIGVSLIGSICDHTYKLVWRGNYSFHVT